MSMKNNLTSLETTPMTTSTPSRLTRLGTWARSQFPADRFCVLSVAGDALVFALRLPVAVLAFVILGRE